MPLALARRAVLAAWCALAVPAHAAGAPPQDPLGARPAPEQAAAERGARAGARVVQVFDLALEAVDSQRPSAAIDWESDFAGRLCAWARSSEVDPRLRIEGEDGARVFEDEDSGGGTTAFLDPQVRPGERLRIAVEAPQGKAGARVELHLARACETPATLALAASARPRLDQMRRLLEAASQAAARELGRAVLEELCAADGAAASPTAASLFQELAREAYLAGDLATAREAMVRAVAHFEERLPPDHPGLQRVKGNLAITLRDSGELGGALRLEEEILASVRRTLGEESPLVHQVIVNHAATRIRAHDFAGARRMLEGLLASSSFRDSPDRDLARLDLAICWMETGELPRARELAEEVADALARSLPGEHPHLVAARVLFANTMFAMGDVHAARELHERNLEALARSMPDEHPSLQIARLNLASVLVALGEREEGLALQEKVLEARERALAEDDHDLLLTRDHVAVSLAELGRLERARELQEAVLAVRERTLEATHGELALSRLHLSETLARQGEGERALALVEAACAVWEDTLPDESPHLAQARASLALRRAELGLREGSMDAAAALATGLRARISGALARGPRESEAVAQSESARISLVLSLAAGAGRFEPDPALQGEAFLLVETARSVATAAALVRREVGADAELASLLESELAASVELARAVQSGAGRDRIALARRTLDEARRRGMERLLQRPSARAVLAAPTPQALAAAIGPEDALVGFWRYARRRIAALGAGGQAPQECLLAFVVRSDATVVRVELGPLGPIEAAARRWRDAVHAPLLRGEPVPSLPLEVEREAGEEVRRLVLDPLGEALAGVQRAIVAPDDVLHAVPLDALPEGGGLVGERLRIDVRTGLRELTWPPPPPPRGRALVAVGGVSFDTVPLALGAQEPSLQTQGGPSAEVWSGSSTPPLLRGGTWERGFWPLPESSTEVRSLAELAGTLAADLEDRVVLTGSRASREALVELAPTARFLHVATHGWFAPETVPSAEPSGILGAPQGYGGALSPLEQVQGTAPLLLCGIALAGANLTADPLQRYPGILTGAEIAALDLRGCELAVLSACDTSVGLRRAGQGVASLQSALHMAGARSVVTSLWKVPDEATRDLMVDFYRRLWVGGEPKAQALWGAKMRLRSAVDETGRPRYRTRDWAGWLLTETGPIRWTRSGRK